MIECLILGDSIAVGLKQQIPQCESLSKGGWNTWQWNKDYLKYDLTAQTVIISLGSNDHKGIKTQEELERLREKITSSRVFWILPAIKPNIQEIVKKIAEQHGDTVVPITRLQPDGVHPSWVGYKELARVVK
jgi:lysophospholipase L1-like esterase